MTEPEIIVSDLTGDSYKLYHHPSSLDVLVMKMEGFTTTEALFATKYGSVNNCFRTTDTGDNIRVPDGIAHYLEHKLFENEECGVFELYAGTGALANAFTSFTATAYTFSTSSDFREPLAILLDFVQAPHFTQENVDKERGIIAQEIKMTNDSPGRAMFFELLDCLYFNHPVKIDIGGTVESINEITPELLYKCYDTFYNLHNMVLAIAGNIDEDEVIRICDEHLKTVPDKKLESFFEPEPEGIVRRRSVIKRQIGVKMFSLGFKCPPQKGIELYKQDIAVSVLLAILFGPLSPWYQKATEDGIINSSFGPEIFASGEGYFAAILEGESKDPDAVYERIAQQLKAVRSGEIQLDEQLFNTILKGRYGADVMRFNNVSECAETMCLNYLEGVDAFEQVRAMSELTLDDLREALNVLDLDKAAFCIVEPLESSVQ